MKKIFSLATLLLAATTAAHAQDPYSNFEMTNTTDVIGSARYVGMGGAMGALGTDISAMSNNPASIGLFRRSDVSITLGAQFQDEKPYSDDSRARMSFDQIGFVVSMPDSERRNFFNWGLNLQKKANYGFSFFKAADNLNGFSQAAQLAGIYSDFPEQPEGTLVRRAYDALLYDLPSGTHLRSTGYDFNRHSRGFLYGLDLNISGNLEDRVYLGLTLGIDFLNYRTSQRYVEYRNGSDGSVQDYDIMSNHRVNGSGFNLKLGAIFRPIEDSPFRVGVTVETPTWYTMTQERSYYSIASKWEYTGYDEATQQHLYSYLPSGEYSIYDSVDGNDLDFNVFSPWKFRLQLGSTVANCLAWDVEYEYALYDYTKMGYPEEYNGGGASISMDKDHAMSSLTKATLNPVHNARVGFEYKPVPELAVRAGYNYWSRPMKKTASLNQSIDSYAMEYTLGTDYMNLSDAHMISFGLGYRYGGFYADLAYKFRTQKGDFYPFDDRYQANGATEAQFETTAYNLASQKVSLDRHNVVLTLGYKF